MIIVGNKLDLPNPRQVPFGTAWNYARDVGASYCECSAKSGAGIPDLTEELGRIALDIEGKQRDVAVSIVEEGRRPEQRTECC